MRSGRSPLGAPPWRFPTRGRSSWLRRRRPLRLNAASHSRPGRSARRAGPRRLPSLRVRAAAAGATPRSASRSPLDGARHRAGMGFNTILGLGCQSFAAGLGKKFHQGGRDLGLSNERDRAQTATPQPPPRNAGTIGATRLGRANGLPARGFPCLAARRWLHSGPPSGARVPSAAERWLSG